MKLFVRLILIILTLILMAQCKKDRSEPQPNNEITDANFLKALIERGADTDGDSIISPMEAEMVTSLMFQIVVFQI